MVHAFWRDLRRAKKLGALRHFKGVAVSVQVLEAVSRDPRVQFQEAASRGPLGVASPGFPLSNAVPVSI